jgi:DNA gyrase subunit A
MAIEDQRQIVPRPIEDEMKEAYVDYAMSVIVSRALPDVRDGLKPVHRRILYTMYEESITPDRPFRKSAATVGNVLARYHPHGDASVYDAMVRMAQDFNLRYPLVQGHGNFGSVDGDSAAHMRYTEARLARPAMEMLRDLDKDTVDWWPNFDNTTQEPAVLPCMLPNLLVNGSDGIAVGMATKIPPHNLREVVDGTLALLEDKDLSLERLMQYIPGPDFPTGGRILGQHGIRDAYATGRGSITTRAVMEVEEIRRDKRAIIVTEIPYQVNKARLVERIADAVKEKRIEGISDLRDESNRKGMRIVIELRNDAIPDVVMNQLYKHSDLQANFGVILLALVDGVPRVLTLKEVLAHFINHRRDVVTRRTRYELDKARKREHIVSGLLKALDHIDEIIALIRASRDADSARTGLMERFGFSQVQAQAILDMRLQRLTGLEREKLEEEQRELLARIEYLEGLLASREKLDGVIRTELLEIQARFGDDRRTKIEPFMGGDFNIEDLIADEQMVVTLSHSGYVKRVPFDTYRVQKRGGRGVSGTDLKEEDFLEHFFVTSTHRTLLFFTNKARVFKLKVHQIPEFGRSARGTAVVNLLSLAEGEKIAAVIPGRHPQEGGYIVTATREGMVKRTALKAYANLRTSGLNALVLKEGDELVSVILTPGEPAVGDGAEVDSEMMESEPDEVLGTDEAGEPEEMELDGDESAGSEAGSAGGQELILVTRHGMSIRFPESRVRVMGRVSRGVRGIALRDGDEVVSMDSASNGSQVLLVTENGYGKRTPVDSYRTQNRGGFGTRTVMRTEKTGDVVAARVVEPEHELMVSTFQGTLIRTTVAEIRETGRTAQGVRIIKLSDEDKVTAMARVIPEEDEEVAEEVEVDPEEGVEGLEADPAVASLPDEDLTPQDTDPLEEA